MSIFIIIYLILYSIIIIYEGLKHNHHDHNYVSATLESKAVKPKPKLRHERHKDTLKDIINDKKIGNLKKKLNKTLKEMNFESALKNVCSNIWVEIFVEVLIYVAWQKHRYILVFVFIIISLLLLYLHNKLLKDEKSVSSNRNLLSQYSNKNKDIH